MSADQDPRTCTECGTVNAYTSVECRSCGASLNDQFSSGEDEPHIVEENSLRKPAERPVGSQRRRWNVLWLIIGVLLYIPAMDIGGKLVLKWVTESDPELTNVIEEVMSTDPEKPLLENDKVRLRSVLFSSKNFVLSVILLLFLVPVLIGFIVGFFSAKVLEGAGALGLAAVLLLFISGQPAWALAFGPINAVLGALGAYGGSKFLTVIRRSTKRE